MSDSILDFYAKHHASFLHGDGLGATRKMLAALSLQGQEKVLEIGCGTGASLVFLQSYYPNLQLTGVDISPQMHRKARQRLAFAGFARRIELGLLDGSGALPFADDSYNVIWVESVLAIMPTAVLQGVLQEAKRLLKPGGRLVFNESLWLPDVPQVKIDEINAACLKHFGIIQANGDYPTAADWQELLVSSGFAVQQKVAFSDLQEEVPLPKGLHYWRSRVFDRLGQLWVHCLPGQRRYYRTLRQLEQQLMGDGPQRLAAYLFIAK